MKDKYYTPTVEEFHVGFEFEYFDTSGKLMKHPSNIEEWKHDVCDWGWLDRICDDYEHDLENVSKLYRVKILDVVDIESIEFKKRSNNQWVGYNDYILETISGEYGYFLNCTVHVPRMDDMYKIYVHRHLNGEVNDIETQLKNGESELVFKGKIKNKSEFKKILKQLNII